MFCQQCGAELRVEAGFCAVCGAAAPQPKLHIDQPEKSKQKQQPGTPARQPKAANNELFSSALPTGALTSGSHAGTLVPTKAQPNYEAIRNASSFRGNVRHVAPIASLEVRSSTEPPAPKAVPPETPPAETAAPAPEQTVLPDQPEAAAPAPVAAASTTQYVVLAPASVMSPQPQSAQNGHHLNGHQQQAAAPRRAEDALAGGSYTRQVIGATRGGLRVPQDVPNRVVLGALAVMFLCFFLPWVIIGGNRATPLSIGWPVVLPLAVLAGAMLTIVMPGRALYARFFLAVPLGLGCFGLGCALLLFLLSSAVAANNVGASFLGVDIGFAFFVAAALALIIGGYYKLLRELPLLQSGQLPLAPLPGILRALSENAASGSAQPAASAQQAHSQAGVAHQTARVPLDQAG